MAPRASKRTKHLVSAVRVLAIILLLGTCGAGFAAAAAAALSPPVPAADWFSNPVASAKLARGENPAPVRLNRDPVAPLSAMAQLGRLIFFDPRLSSSGRLSCASCHNPQNSYGPVGDAPAMFGGATLKRQGARAVPSLMYLEYQPNFTIGPDPGGDSETPAALPQLAAKGLTAARATKTAQTTAQSAANLVPQGGIFWDGRADTLQAQAMGPLLNPLEMDGGSIARIVGLLKAAPYAKRFDQLFGAHIWDSQNLASAEALFAVARYQIEDPSFHPYSSRYDAWLEGKTRLNTEEIRGFRLFNDPAKGDCAACHLDQPTAEGRPPLFTDHQFEALGVPRNPQLKLNQNPAYFDLGVCGPYRTDLSAQTQYCGMFLTPTLRNSATRQVFFHNGADHTLQQVMDFYNDRDTAPYRVYPKDKAGVIAKYNDLPKRYWPNIDTADPPFDRKLGDAPPLSAGDEADIIAFLKTLDDGYIRETDVAPRSSN